MAIELLLNRKTPAQIGELQLDASLDQQHEYNNTVTEYPVEDGANISDHVRHDPEQVTIRGFVSNSPIPMSLNFGEIGDTFNESFGGSILSQQIRPDASNRADVAFTYLLQVAGFEIPNANVEGAGKEPILVDIITGLRVYTDMVLVSLSVPRTPQTGRALRFTARFRKLRKVNSKVVEIQFTSENKPGSGNTNNQAARKKDIGSQGTSETSNEVQSILYKLFIKP